MKYVTLFFWTFILGEVLGYIASALMAVSYDATTVSLFSAIIASVAAIVALLISKSSTPKIHQHQD
ncbi:DMSO reductase anchor subunit [Weissella uvarum]|uniref:YjzD family protein n=1 Tax=Weissella uvarum TaxID=1479233 RepID=UPI00195FF1EE|nr:YjzD family protein [Weissella uvarum]MBM7617087.1 DMSO reductase anchor subunit [Weissella uvarum]MCM0595383.1 YjzD family protein [Weissella uvarum]